MAAPAAAPTADAIHHDLGSYPCTAVLLNGIACPVEMHPCGEPTVQVRFEGSARRKAELRVRGRGPGSVLSIEDTSPGEGITVSNLRSGNVVVGNMSVSADSTSSVSVSSGGCSIQMAGGRVKINGVDVTEQMRNGGGVAIGASDKAAEQPARLVLRVPLGMALSLNDMRADATIGDVGGNLSVYSSGVSRVAAGKVRGLEVTIAGSGRVEVAEVAGGPCQAHISGSGRVRVRRGNVGKAVASITGSGNVRYDVTAEEADLSITGSGEIDLFRATKRLRKRKTGSGAITVGSMAAGCERI